MARYSVYADLNCPFSYALHQQLGYFGLLDQVEWHLIEHSPDTAVYNSTPESQAELASDVFVVRSRAPQVELALPKKRSDSRFASLCVIQAREIDPSKAANLLQLLYRALWIEGKDIADVSVIFDCLTAAGLPAEVTIEDNHEQQLAKWQNEWEQGEYNLRIPILIAEDGRVSQGLPNHKDLHAFFKGEEIDSDLVGNEGPPRCEQQTIALYSDYSIEVLWPLISLLRNDCNILLPSNLTELKDLLREDPPGLLLLGSEDRWQDMLQLCRETLEQCSENPFPISFISQEQDDHIELETYNAGASDFLLLQRSAAILQSRIQFLLQLKQSQEQLAKSARIDGLTQVNNRREFERNIEVEWRRAQRGKRNLSLIMIDIDHFKEFNDFYGHLAGDGCLRTIAQTIDATFQRSQDMVCRYGGEEFVVILPDTDIQGAEVIADKMGEAVSNLKIEHQRSDTESHVTISLGVACMNPFIEGSPHELISLADKALYQAKASGRNQVAKLPASE